MSIQSNNRDLSIVILILIRIDAIAKRRAILVVTSIDNIKLDKNAFTLVNIFMIIDNILVVVANAFLAIAITNLRNIEKNFFYTRFS